MEFVSFPKGERRILEQYLEEFRMPEYGHRLEKMAS